jgi:hypothetical protein
MISVLVVLIVFGVALYLVELLPMDATFKTIIRVIAILFVLLWLLQVLGVWSGFHGLR